MAFAPVAIIHADPKVAQTITRWLDQAGYSTQRCADLKDGLANIRKDKVGFLIADEDAPAQNSQTIYECFKTNAFSVPVIFLSENATVQRAVEAVKLGASDYLSAPVDEKVLLGAVAKVHAAQKPQSTKLSATPEKHRHMVARSECMRNLVSLAERVAASSATVLIQGESGTGKELLARHLHFSSDRKKQPFIAMNCAALPENLAESELFGYEKGAFTGAAKARLGKFEQAHTGTLFLDELGTTDNSFQVNLLRVLESGELI